VASVRLLGHEKFALRRQSIRGYYRRPQSCRGLRFRATSFDDVIDPVEPKHSHDNQIDCDGETHDARRDHEKYSAAIVAIGRCESNESHKLSALYLERRG
jgi:hypothetical protein